MEDFRKVFSDKVLPDEFNYSNYFLFSLHL